MAKPFKKLRATIDQIRENEKDPEKMKLKEYLGYTMGHVCYGSISKLSDGYLSNFYMAKGLTPTRMSFLMTAQKLFDSVNDPIVASIIDGRKRTPNGRFKPYLAKLAPLLAALSIAMFICPSNDITFMTVWFFITYMVWETVNTFSRTAFDAVSTVMSTDQDERTMYSTMGNIGIQIAGFVPGAIPVAQEICTKQFGMNQANFFAVCAVIFAVIGGVAGIFTKDIKERIQPEKKAKHFWENFQTFFKNKYLLLLWATNISQFISAAAYPANSQFFIHSIGNYGYQTLLWTLAGIPHYLSYALAPFLLKRFRPSRIGIWTKILNAVCFGLMYVVVMPMGHATDVGFVPGYRTPLGIFLVLLFNGLAWFPSSIADVAKNIMSINTFDYTDAKTGERAEATSLMIAGNGGVLSKWVTLIGTAVSGMLLNKIGFKVKEPGAKFDPEQTQRTKDGLFFIFSVFPVVSSLLATIPLFFFNLEGKEYEKRMAELRAQKAAKAAIEAELAQQADA